MERRTMYLGKAKFWNVVLLVFGAINGMMGIAELPSLLNPETTVDLSHPSLAKVTDPNLIKTVEKSMTILNNPFYQGYAILMLVVTSVLVAMFFRNHQGMARGTRVSLWPYYIQLIKLVLAIVVSFITGAALTSPSLALTTLLLNLAWALPAVLVIAYLKKSYLEPVADLTRDRQVLASVGGDSRVVGL